MLMRLENYEGLLNYFEYFSFLFDLLLWQGHFGHNTHTLMHSITYLSSVLQNILDPDKDGLQSWIKLKIHKGLLQRLAYSLAFF